MERSAIVLAGGFSSRLGQDKGLLRLANKPLIRHVIDAIKNIIDERFVVVSSKAQAENYAKAIGSTAKVLIDKEAVQSPLVGALTGFERTHSRYSILLPCDAPFLSEDVILLLFEIGINKNAVIPRWPNGYIEPLQAVYCTNQACEAANHALNEGRLNMKSLVDRLHGIRYVSTLVLQQFDPELYTFFNIHTSI